jgi:hypothetical protein
MVCHNHPAESPGETVLLVDCKCLRHTPALGLGLAAELEEVEVHRESNNRAPHTQLDPVGTLLLLTR